MSITRLARLRHPRSSRTREGRRRARLASALWPPLRSDRGSVARSDFLFKMLLIGDSGVGKSCLLLRFAVRCLPPPCAPALSRRSRPSQPRPRATAGCQVRGGLPLDHRRGLCARRPAPRPAAALALSVECWLRATLRKSGPWRSTARRSSSSWCARPPRARTATARAAASAGPLASSAHGCRLLLRAAVGHCRAGALPDDHEQLLPREPGHHDRVRRDRPPVRALGAPCLAAAALPLRVIPLADLSTTWTTGSSRSTSTPIPTCRRCAHRNSERLLRYRLTAVLPAVCVCVACSCSWGTRAT